METSFADLIIHPIHMEGECGSLILYWYKSHLYTVSYFTLLLCCLI